MENLTKYTSIELLKIGNEIVVKHEQLKKEIINDTFLIDEMGEKINSKLEQLDELEKSYVMVVEEINNRM